MHTRFSSNNPHLTSSPQLIFSPIAIAGRDKLPTGSYLSTNKKTEDVVIIENKLKDVKDIEDNKKEGEEKRG